MFDEYSRLGYTTSAFRLDALLWLSTACCELCKFKFELHHLA